MNALPGEAAPDEQQPQRPVDPGCGALLEAARRQVDADLERDPHLRLMARRDQAGGVAARDVDQPRRGQRLAGQRIVSGEQVEPVAHQLEPPAARAHAGAEREGRPFAAADRPQHERHRQAAKEARLADHAEGDVVNQVETLGRKPAPDMTVGGKLPRQVHQLQRQAVGGKPAEPAGHEELEGEVRRQLAGGELGADRGLVAPLGEHQDLMAEAGDLERPVPADAGLGAAVRGAGKGAEQDPHDRSEPRRRSELARVSAVDGEVGRSRRPPLQAAAHVVVQAADQLRPAQRAGARPRPVAQLPEQIIASGELLERIRETARALRLASFRGRDHPAAARVDQLGRSADDPGRPPAGHGPALRARRCRSESCRLGYSSA